jgi:hypothetical protein
MVLIPGCRCLIGLPRIPLKIKSELKFRGSFYPSHFPLPIPLFLAHCSHRSSTGRPSARGQEKYYTRAFTGSEVTPVTENVGKARATSSKRAPNKKFVEFWRVSILGMNVLFTLSSFHPLVTSPWDTTRGSVEEAYTK